MPVSRRLSHLQREGELLDEYDARGNNAAKQTEGDHSLISRRQAAEQAGLFERQIKTAVRVAWYRRN